VREIANGRTRKCRFRLSTSDFDTNDAKIDEYANRVTGVAPTLREPRHWLGTDRSQVRQDGCGLAAKNSRRLHARRRDEPLNASVRQALGLVE
jgi:hypothetical protein